MATASHTHPGSEKCTMCLADWASTRQIRWLPCLHGCCMECLQEDQTLNHRTVCSICRVDHRELDLQLLGVAYDGSPTSAEAPTCHARKCTIKSTSFCSQCKHHLCKQHQEAHADLYDHEMLSLADYQLRQEETTPQLCEVHTEYPVILSCGKCQILRCEKCEEIDDCPRNDGEHVIRSVGRVAKALSPVIQEKLDKFSVKIATVEKKLEEVFLESDDIGEDTRLMLEKIDRTVQRMKEQIDQAAAHLKQQILEHHTEVSGQADELTRSINAFLDEGSNWALSVNQILRKSSSAQVKQHAELDGRGERLLAMEFPEFQPTLKRLVDKELKIELPLELTDKESEVELPLELTSPQPPVPTKLRLKEEITTPNRCRTVTHHQGRIIHGGVFYPLTGLDFDPRLGGGDVYFVCKHNNSLYVLQQGNSYKSVHIINLSTQAVHKAVIRYQTPGWNNHLTVNNNQIIITDYSSASVKIYSTSNFTHQFDIESEHLSGHPWGIAQLPDGSIVVSDFRNGLVCNLTLERNPTTKWVRKDLVLPTGITLDSDSQFLLVTSCDGRKIYIMSFSGEVLRELSPPDLQSGLGDISVCGNELVVASGSRCYQVYEINYDTLSSDNI